jgi:hypothetical protein
VIERSAYKIQHSLGVNEIVLYLIIKATEELQGRLQLRKVGQDADEYRDWMYAFRNLEARE